MTWVVGTSTLFGYALVVSDIRASWKDKSYLDCLQKIHLVSPSMIAGFSGSIKIGFRLLGRLEYESSKARQDEDWVLDILANTWWPRIARSIFNKSEPEEKHWGSSIILAAPHPANNMGDTSWPETQVYSFSSPDFEPKKADYETLASVGDVSSFRVEAIRNLVADPSFCEGTTAGPICHGQMLALALSEEREDRPSDLISSLFQFGIVYRGQSEIRNLVVKKFSTDMDNPRSVAIIPGNVCTPFPLVAGTYEEFLQVCQANGRAAGASSC